MEIVLKDSLFCVIVCKGNTPLDLRLISTVNCDIDEIPHFRDAKILYHYDSTYVDKSFGVDMLPVYYESNTQFVTAINNMLTIRYKRSNMIKDYTLINLNLLEDESNI